MTHSLDPELLALLGLAASDTLSLVESHPTPSEQVAHGRGVLDLVWALAASVQLWQPVGDIALRHADEPRFVAFYQEDVVDIVSGKGTQGGGRVAFDTRGVQVCVRLTDGAVVVAKDGAIERYEIGTADRFTDLDVPDAAPSIPAFDGVRWAEATGAETWLQTAVATLAAQGANIPNAASAGLLARLWTRPEGHEVARAELPRERVRAWILAASDEQRGQLEHQAVTAAWSLAERLQDLDGVVDSASAVADIVEQRDDLQSVLRVLRLGGGGDELAHALRGVDGTAGERAASLANVLPSLDDDPQQERWRAVAWQEPDAWWAGGS